MLHANAALASAQASAVLALFQKLASQAWRAKRRGNAVTDRPEWFDFPHEYTPERLALAAEALDVYDHAVRVQRERARNQEEFDRLRRFLPGRGFDEIEIKNLAAERGEDVKNLRVAISKLTKGYGRTLCRVMADALELEPGTDPQLSPLVRRELRLLTAALDFRSSPLAEIGERTRRDRQGAPTDSRPRARENAAGTARGISIAPTAKHAFDTGELAQAGTTGSHRGMGRADGARLFGP